MEESPATLLQLALKYSGNQEICNRIDQVFGSWTEIPLKTFVQIHQNWKVFKLVTYISHRLFANLDTPVLAKKQNEILLYLGKIDLYAVFTPDEYKQFARFSSKKDVYQIILLTEQQKVVLLHDQDPEFIKELINTAKKSSDYELLVREDEKQLEIKDKIAKNYEESREIYNDLTNALYKKYKNIRQIIKMIEPDVNGFYSQVIKFPIHRSDFGELSKLGTVVVFTGNITNSTVVNGSGNTVNSQPPSKNDRIIDWLKQNSPTEPITLDDLRVKCSSALQLEINNMHLGKLLKLAIPDIKKHKKGGIIYYSNR